MAARRTPNPRRSDTKPTNQKDKPGPIKNPLALEGKSLLQASYGTGLVDKGMQGVLDYYKNLPRAQRKAAYQEIANTVKNRDFSNWSNPFYSVLSGDLPDAARAKLMSTFAERNDGMVRGGTATEDPTAAAGGETMFSTGVSGLDQTFIKEAGQSKYKAGAAQTNTTKNKKKKAQRKKLVKRAVKKTNVKGKAIRRALKSDGITKADKRVYKKVAAQATPKLSARLRVADRRNDRKGK